MQSSQRVLGEGERVSVVDGTWGGESIEKDQRDQQRQRRGRRRPVPPALLPLSHLTTHVRPTLAQRPQAASYRFFTTPLAHLHRRLHTHPPSCSPEARPRKRTHDKKRRRRAFAPRSSSHRFRPRPRPPLTPSSAPREPRGAGARVTKGLGPLGPSLARAPPAASPAKTLGARRRRCGAKGGERQRAPEGRCALPSAPHSFPKPASPRAHVRVRRRGRRGRRAHEQRPRRQRAAEAWRQRCRGDSAHAHCAGRR